MASVIRTVGMSADARRPPLAVDESRISRLDQRAQVGVLGVERLNPDLPRAVAPTRAPGNLDDELSGAFRRAEIRRKETAIRIENRHQRDVRKVMALGEHLRSDEYGRIPFGDGGEVRLETPRAPDRVAVDTIQGYVGMPRS